MNKLYTLFIISFIVIMAFSANAFTLTAQQIYKYAKSKNYNALSHLRNYLETQDSKGNTALCLAIINDDYETYSLLRQYGANSQPYCLQSAITASSSSTFLGMGTTGWLTTGAIVAGGVGIAAAAAGGGGGGGGGDASSSDSSSSNNSTPAITCVNGSINNGQCQCNDGWTGLTCEQAKAVPSGYTSTPCGEGYTQVDTFLSGAETYYKCSPATCDGFEYTTCPNGYESSGICLSGMTTKHKCAPAACSGYIASCSQGYHITTDTCLSGTIIMYKCEINDCSGYNLTSAPIHCASSQSCQSGSSISYKCGKCVEGWTGSDCSIVEEADDNPLIGTNNDVNNSTIDLSNYKNRDVYGIGMTSYNTLNAESTDAEVADAVIDIIDYGSNNSVYGVYAENNAENARTSTTGTSTATGKATASIHIENNRNTFVYGLKGANAWNAISLGGQTNGIIDIVNNNNTGGIVYGLYATNASYNANAFYSSADGKINIENIADNDVYGIYGHNVANNGFGSNGKTPIAVVNIQNNGDGNVYGLVSEIDDYIQNYTGSGTISNVGNHNAYNSYATISITNTGDGNVYGMKSQQDLYNAYGTSTGIINITNTGNGNVYGMKSQQDLYNAYGTSTGIINITNTGDGNAYGMFADNQGNILLNTSSDDSSQLAESTIELSNIGDGLTIGIYSKDGKAENSGTIKIHNLKNGSAIGIYADGNTKAYNSGNITIDHKSYTDNTATENIKDDKTYTTQSKKGGLAIGIYGAKDSKISNSGTIEINGAETAYGIYAESDATVENSGIITIDDDINHTNKIVLNGSVLFQDGKFIIQNSYTSTPAQLNLDDFGGMVVASDTSQFIVEGSISGDLAINNSVIENGFDTTYSVKDMIQAEDTNGLNLLSQSALFDAKLENNTDAVMTMKAFNDVVESSSVADFLQNNYVSNNNEDLFKTLKSAGTVAQLNSNIDDLLGKDMLSRMAFEDLSMIREVSFDMNNHLFEKEGSFAFGENISPSSYDNNIGSVGRYSLNGYNNGKLSFGVGVSITDVRTNDGNNDNRRFDRNFMMSAPIGYKTHGFELITAPKLGYANGTYDRNGFNNMPYEGKVQKRLFALMNEARYPVKFGGLKLVPTAEFNMIGYNIKGHEDEKQYSLWIKSQNHYSVEAGLGLLAEKEFKPYKNHKFDLNGGVAVYHEFANPYELNVAMNGMSGTYRLQDEKRSDNRAVVRFGFGYELEDNVDISASWLTNIDREYRTDAKIDLKYSF